MRNHLLALWSVAAAIGLAADRRTVADDNPPVVPERVAALRRYWDGFRTVSATFHWASHDPNQADDARKKDDWGTSFDWREDLRSGGYWAWMKTKGSGPPYEEANVVAARGGPGAHLVLPSKGSAGVPQLRLLRKEPSASRSFPTPLWAIGLKYPRTGASLRELSGELEPGVTRKVGGVSCVKLQAERGHEVVSAFVDASGPPLVREVRHQDGYAFTDIEYRDVPVAGGVIAFPSRFRSQWRSGEATFFVTNVRLNEDLPASKFVIDPATLPAGVKVDDEVANVEYVTKGPDQAAKK